MKVKSHYQCCNNNKPFYIFGHSEKFRSTKPSEFANDLNLHSFTTNEMFSENFPSDNIVPRKIEKKSSKHKKSDTEYDESVASILSGSWLVSKEFGKCFAFYAIWSTCLFCFLVEKMGRRFNFVVFVFVVGVVIITVVVQLE